VTATTLITGATGFVGSHAAEALREAGHELRLTVRAGSDRRWIEGIEGERVELDLRQPDALDRALEGVRRVLHVAGVTRAPDPSAFRRVNVEGTAALARAALRAGARRFVFVSSLAARGPDGSPGPESAYGRSKREAERRLASLSGDLEVVALRPGGVYGPRDVDLFPLFRAASAGWIPVPAGGGVLQPVYVEDVAAAGRAALDAAAPTFGPHPVAEARRYSWAEVAEALSRALGRRVRRIPVPSALAEAAGAVAELAGRVSGSAPTFDRRRARDLARHRWTCDPSGTERELGWRARVALSEGLRSTARWYREAGWL